MTPRPPVSEACDRCGRPHGTHLLTCKTLRLPQGWTHGDEEETT